MFLRDIFVTTITEFLLYQMIGKNFLASWVVSYHLNHGTKLLEFCNLLLNLVFRQNCVVYSSTSKLAKFSMK